MGYTTEFKGSFSFDREVEQRHADYINAFSRTRRMLRNAEIAKGFPDPIREQTGLPIGPDGAYYVGSTDNWGQNNDASVIEHNSSGRQPGLWCQWVVSEDRKHLQWDGGEKFYNYIEWLEYLIEHFFEPWGYKLQGIVKWRGEDFDDYGSLIVVNNMVTTESDTDYQID
jgi:hypothetical protein